MMNSEPQEDQAAAADACESTKETSDTPSSLGDVSRDKVQDDGDRQRDKDADVNAKIEEQSEIKYNTVIEETKSETVPANSQQERLNAVKTVTDAMESNMNGSPSSKSPSKYTSAAATILGDTSDRDDFLPNSHSYNKKNKSAEDKRGAYHLKNEGGIIDDVKKWFSSPTPETDSTKHVDHDYHRDVVDNIQSAISSRIAAATERELKITQVKNLDDNNFDESLLDKNAGDVEMGRQRSSTYDEIEVRRSMERNGDCDEGGNGKSKFKYDNGSWSKKSRSKTDDELRVMGECSFFYDGMDNEENHSPSQKIPRHEISEEEKENEYFREGNYPHKLHRARVVNPRQIAQALSSSARRKWTERRYRRRLKQSTFEPPASMWKNRRRPQHIDSIQSQEQPDLPTYELTTEHRQAFLAAHAALNDKLANEYSRNKHAINIAEYGYDLDLDLDLSLAVDDNQQEEIRADLTKSSLAIRGSGQIRLPIDNVRLVMDSHLQPGILSVETRAGGGAYMGYESYGNGNRYGNINANELVPLSDVDKSGESKKKRKDTHRRMLSETDQPWRRNELSYVLTVDDSLYRRLFQEISDSYRLPFGVYYCCHVVESEGSHDHVGIGVAILILMAVFVFLVVGMLVWPA